MDEAKEKKIFYQLAKEMFKNNSEVDMAKSQEACFKIAKKYLIEIDELYRILGKGWQMKFKTPPYPKVNNSL